MDSTSKVNNLDTDFLNKFRYIKTDGLPEFENFTKPLGMGLWVLWIAKEKLNKKTLTARQIADVIVKVNEVSIEPRAISNSFNPVSKGTNAKINVSRKDSEVYYEIMKPGKDYLLAATGKGSVEVYYFEPDKKYSSKRIMRDKILDELKGELKIVDPYCDLGTLDILSHKQNEIKFITQLAKLQPNVKQRFQRELQNFKSEYSNIKFKEYSISEIHDRYIISKEKLVILGYSLKDLGTKESFAIVLDKRTSKDVYEALTENFNRRWKNGTFL